MFDFKNTMMFTDGACKARSRREEEGDSWELPFIWLQVTGFRLPTT